MTTPQERANVAGYVLVWARATHRQRERLLELMPMVRDRMAKLPEGDDVTDQVESEGVLFAMALRCLIRAVEWAADDPESRLEVALERFRRAVPHAVHIRNLLDHFDAYETGGGELRKQAKPGRGGREPAPRIEDYGFFFEHEDETVVRIHLFASSETGELVLDVVGADEAAQRLAEEALEVLLYSPGPRGAEKGGET